MTAGRFFLCLAFLAATAAEGRELYWKELDVNATLDREGVLHVRERHAMVFTGDWNGGERTFDVRSDQQLTLTRISRIDPGHDLPVVLEEGSLDLVDQWQWAGDNKLRWRSRRPEDPDFSNTRIDYLIEYSLSGVLRSTLNGTYRLRHDFAFPDRPAVIETLRLDLRIDPSWRALSGGSRSITTGPLPPGKRYVVEAELAGGGLTRPTWRDVLREHRDLARRLMWILATLFALTIIWAAFYFREKRLGRFEPLSYETIDWSSLEREVLPLKAEVIAAVHAGSVTETAIAALLARLTAEGKIRSWSQANNVLGMELLRPIETFDGYEQDLLQALFLGKSATDSRKVRAHYRSSGFNPLTLITGGVAAEAQKAIGEPLRRASLFRPLAMVFFAGLVISAVVLHYDTPRAKQGLVLGGLIGAGVILFFVAAADMMKAEIWRKEERATARETPSLLRASILALVVAAIIGFFVPAGAGVAVTRTGSLASIAFALLAFSFAATTAGPRMRRWQRRLGNALYLLRRETDRNTPISDRFIPLLVALGLGERTSLVVASEARGADPDRWHERESPSLSSSASSDAERPSFGGGGGAFGGAGATASWAAAASTLASGVAAPSSGSSGSSSSSSSSSSGSSGSSNSSSGGGGGGGW